VIASDGFICHSPAVDGMAGGGEDENEMDGVTKVDDALLQTKKKRNKKPLGGHKRVLNLLEMLDCKLRNLSKVGGDLGDLEFR
jgi:hypothetical protein